ncbi:MAG: right-handed parallel beta-helix repeat-containing protein [Anaerolineae bacterium]|nr:right-handed parallel beta-helix repeat-containing protein [Anaerolineae bacterium]
MNLQRILTRLLLFALLVPALPTPLQAMPDTPAQGEATILVNSLGDQGDPDTTDGICDTTGRRDPPASYSGICTLRAAILTANHTPAADVINFSVAGQIKPLSQTLPAILHPVAIEGDGITLDGSSLPAGTHHGLALFENSGGSTIENLTVVKFSGWGVLVADNVGGTTVENNTLQENRIGVYIGRSSPNNTIANNVIVLNTTGIEVVSNNNTIKGNKIGTDGASDLGNSGNGVLVYGANNLVGSASGLTVSGSCSGDCNLIAGNGASGIDIVKSGGSPGANNVVRGNFIGVNLAGSAAIPNDGNGVATNGEGNQIIGNLISGNGKAGTRGGTHGVYFKAGATGNVVRGNLIGTAINGATPLGNEGAGVYVEFANQNVIGAGANALSSPGTGVNAVPTTCTGSCNVILGNRTGIHITQAVSPGLNKIVGNFIGVAANGLSAPGNLNNGVFIQGLTTTVAGNVISGNRGHGIEILGVSVGGIRPVNQHMIQGNHVGVLPDGVTQAGNGRHGIFINRSADNWIGGTEAGQGNIIAYNGAYPDPNSTYDGVAIVDLFAVGNRILGNSIFNNGSPASGPGIDLGDDGSTVNDRTDADLGPNNLQNYPVIRRLEGLTVTGVLTSTAITGFRLEFFGSPSCTALGFGQGKDFLGSFDVVTDHNGVATFQQALATAPGRRIVTATATDLNTGNTSEFSACYAELIVNSAEDRDDARLDGVCATGRTVADGRPECTLRAAIREANREADVSTIFFNIPTTGAPPRISLSSALPPITKPAVIDGTTQRGSRVVVVDGRVTGTGTSGLVLLSGESQVRGLSIVNFPNHGIELIANGGNLIAGNWIGVEPDGTVGGNGGHGILVRSQSNRIGGFTPAEGNVIVNNGSVANGSGIYLASYAANTEILGNWIGVSLGGRLGGNRLAGVYVDGSPNNVIGELPIVSGCANACNVIGGNRYGVMATGATATGNQVLGNYIGLTAGDEAAPNSQFGVIIDNAANNTVSRNIIANTGRSTALAAALTEGDGILINGSGATGNTISENTIGLDRNAAAQPNARHGIWLEQAPNNTIVSNVIGGNGGSGVMIHGSAAAGNAVRSNLVGVAPDGAAPRSNGGNGVTIDAAPSNTIGGATAGHGNLISGNAGHGVHITGAGAQNNTVAGNQIGANRTNTAALPNAGDGVRIDGGAASNTIGGMVDGDNDANLIVGNGNDGVEINGAATGNNVVAGNYIGVLPDGTTAMPNSGHGVYISGGAFGNRVGAASRVHGNFIARNGGDGVYVRGGGARNAIWQNRIFGNNGLGIDLDPNGVTLNDPLDPDTGPNLLQNFPLLTSVQLVGGTATLKGALESTPNTTVRLDFYANSQCDPSGFGEGETPLGSTTATTDASGYASFTFAPGTSLAGPMNFAATASDPSRSTSELSPCAGASTEAVVTPTGGGALNAANVNVAVPPGAVAAEVTLALMPLPAPANAASDGMGFGGVAFLLTAFVSGQQQRTFTFQQPVRVTVQYTDAAIAGLDENTLTLLYWNGTAWADAATTCTPISAYVRQPAMNTLSVDICHLSPHALMGRVPQRARPRYLPLIMR